MRSVADTSLPAFIGWVEQALTHFLGDEGVCQLLQPVLGNMDSPASRWRDLTTSGCRTGEELVWAWETLRREAAESSQYLGKDLDGPLVVRV